MRLLFISNKGEALPLAMHSKRPWTTTKLFVREGPIGEGIVDLVNSPLKEAKEADIAILTSSELHEFEKQVSKWCPTIGGSRFEHSFNSDGDIPKRLYRLGGGLSSFLPPSTSHDEEIIVGAWFGKGGFRLPAAIGTVSQGMFAGDKGLQVEGVGIAATSDTSRKLYSLLLEPYSQSLRRSQYVGFIEVRAAVIGAELHPISVHAGLDSYLLPAIRELTDSALPTFFKSLHTGATTSSGLRPQYAIAVMISIPPFPYTADIINNVPLSNVDSKNLKHLWMLDVHKLNGTISCAGLSGALGYVTAYGNSIKEAKRRVYRTIDRLSIPQVQYRHDIGDKLPKLLSRLNLSDHTPHGYGQTQ